MRRLAPWLGRALALVGVLLVVGLLPWLTRADPARTVLRARYADREPSTEVLADIRAELGLDAGPLRMFADWLAGLPRGDFGTSWVSGQPVAPDAFAAFGVSLTLMAAASVVALPLAGALVWRTLRRGAHGGAPRAGTLAAVLAALPEFLLAAVLAAVFGVQLGWFPAMGWAGPHSVVLPALAMGVSAGAVLGRLLDDALTSAFGEPWVPAASGRGLPPRRIASHALRRALPGLLPQFGFLTVGLAGGAVTVEFLFDIPGLGRTALSAALAQNLPVLQAAVLLLLLLAITAGAGLRLLRRGLLGSAFAGRALAVARPPAGSAGPLIRVAFWTLAALLFAVVVAGLLRDPLAVNPAARLVPPDAVHPLGTDALGRDVLARLGHGAALTLLTALGVTAVALLAGVLIGLTAPGEGAAEVFNALPPVIAALLVAGIAGPGPWGAAAAVAAVAWAPLAGHVHALYRQERAAPHLTSAIALGATPTYVLRRHILPGVLPPVIRHALLRVPPIALALASLSFLGLGAAPPAPEWGRMLAENLPYAERAPWAVFVPAAALASLGALAVLLAALVRTPHRNHRGIRAAGGHNTALR